MCILGVSDMRFLAAPLAPVTPVPWSLCVCTSELEAVVTFGDGSTREVTVAGVDTLATLSARLGAPVVDVTFPDGGYDAHTGAQIMFHCMFADSKCGADVAVVCGCSVEPSKQCCCRRGFDAYPSPTPYAPYPHACTGAPSATLGDLLQTNVLVGAMVSKGSQQ